MRDLPFRWFDAIRMAMVFIGFDELAKDERPPRKIWLDEQALKAWFDQVEKDREKKYGGKGKGGADEIMEGEPVDNKVTLVSG